MNTVIATTANLGHPNSDAADVIWWVLPIVVIVVAGFFIVRAIWRRKNKAH